MSATLGGGLSTFLLEVALNRRRVKERLAALLIEERGRRAPDGSGDPRRFPQPEMARLLGYSLRQYQRLEDPEDGSLPRFDQMQQLLEKLDRPSSDVYGDEEPPSLETTGEDDDVNEDRLARMEEEVGEVRELLEAVARAVGVPVPGDDGSGEEPGREAPGPAA